MQFFIFNVLYLIGGGGVRISRDDEVYPFHLSSLKWCEWVVSKQTWFSCNSDCCFFGGAGTGSLSGKY